MWQPSVLFQSVFLLLCVYECSFPIHPFNYSALQVFAKKNMTKILIYSSSLFCLFISLWAYYGSIPFSVEEILLSMPHIDPTAIEYPHQLLMREASSTPSPTHSHNQYSQWWMRSNDKLNMLVRLHEQMQASSRPTNQPMTKILLF